MQQNNGVYDLLKMLEISLEEQSAYVEENMCTVWLTAGKQCHQEISFGEHSMLWPAMNARENIWKVEKIINVKRELINELSLKM